MKPKYPTIVSEEKIAQKNHLNKSHNILEPNHRMGNVGCMQSVAMNGKRLDAYGNLRQSKHRAFDPTEWKERILLGYDFPGIIKI